MLASYPPRLRAGLVSICGRLRSLIAAVELKAVPKTRWGDRYIAYRNFIRHHGRPSRRDGSLNDAIYFLKTGLEGARTLRAHVTDKEHLKHYVRERVGDTHNVPTHAILRSVKEARGYTFPPNCVIKPTHMSGEVMFRRDGSAVSWSREIVYRRLEPKIIIEPLIFDGQPPNDYKIFCVHGQPQLIWVDADRHTDHKRNFYATDWQLLPAALAFEQGPPVPRPQNLARMLEISRALSGNFNFIRVDLYTNGKETLVGELTNFSGDAHDQFLLGEEIVGRQLFGSEGLQGFLAARSGET